MGHNALRLSGRSASTVLIAAGWLGMAVYWGHYRIVLRPLQLEFAQNVRFEAVDAPLSLESVVQDPPSIEANAAEDYVPVLRRVARTAGWQLADDEREMVVRATAKKFCDFAPFAGRIDYPGTCLDIRASVVDSEWHVVVLADIADRLMNMAHQERLRKAYDGALQWYSRALIIGFHLCLDRKSKYELQKGLDIQERAARQLEGIVGDCPTLSGRLSRVSDYRRKLAGLANQLTVQEMSYAIVRGQPISMQDIPKFLGFLYTEAAIRVAEESGEDIFRIDAIHELGSALRYAEWPRWELFRIKRVLRRLAQEDGSLHVRRGALSALRKDSYLPAQ